MHQALYRKWRPRDFDDVCGQQHITSILKNEIETGRINHAYLFCGSRGTGKTTCAKILAKAINCTDYKNGKVCGKCAACLNADSGNTTDIVEMDAASNNGVSNIRDIRDEVNYLPGELKYKVYIIDEVHMLSISAFNALLKTLEEPPSHVVFILATTELHKLPSTIVSRCQRFDFKRIGSSVIADRLEFIAKNEGIALEREAAYSLASIAQGGMRDAISLFELCANGANGGAVTEDIVEKLVGTGDRDAVEKTVDAIAGKDYSAIFEITSNIYMSSRDISVYMQALTGVYRDMLIAKTTPRANEYLDLSENKFEKLKALSGRFSAENIIYHIRLLDETCAKMQNANANKKLLAECALVKMCDEKLSPTYEALISRVASLEAKLAGGHIEVRTEKKEAVLAEKSEDKKEAFSEKPKNTEYEKMPEPPVIEPKVKKEASQPQENRPQAKNDNRDVRRLKKLPYFSEAVRAFGDMYPMESAFLDSAVAFAEDNGNIRIRVDSGFASTMLTAPEVFDALCQAFNTYENGRLDKSTLLIETAEAAQKSSFIDEIIEE